MNRIKSFFDDKCRSSFLCTAIMMFITHGFCFANLMFSHDSLKFYDTDSYEKILSGRWLHPFLIHRLHGRSFATPWMVGVFSTLFISIAVVLVVKTYEFNKIQSICTAILFSTNITLTALFSTYIYDADANCFAILTACFAVYSFKRFPKWFNIITSIISVVVCLALYQAHICLIAGLLLLIVLQEVTIASDWNQIRNVAFQGLKAAFVLLAGIALYIPLMIAASKFYDIPLLNGYHGPGQLKSLSSSSIIGMIPLSYSYFMEFFLKTSEYNSGILVKLNWMMIVLSAISCACLVLGLRKNWRKMIIMVPCVALIPMALNAIYIASMGEMHQLMIFAFSMAYLLPLIVVAPTLNDNSEIQSGLLVKKIRNCLYALTVFAIVVIGIHHAIYNNGAYVFKKLVYDNTVLHAQTIWKDVNSIEGYKDGETLVCFVGEFEDSKAAYNSSVGEKYYNAMTGAWESSITYLNSENYFFYGILGREMRVARDFELDEDEYESKYADMPSYPQDGYCKIDNGRMIVKLSDSEE